VSACGNFGIAGSSTGLVYMWNMQSGIKRKIFALGTCPPEVEHRFSKRGKERSVTGLACDALNRVVIVATLDGTLNVCVISRQTYRFLIMFNIRLLVL
jgi:U3 small nucleolar RNA-associated protein 21